MTSHEGDQTLLLYVVTIERRTACNVGLHLGPQNQNRGEALEGVVHGNVERLQPHQRKGHIADIQQRDWQQRPRLGRRQSRQLNKIQCLQAVLLLSEWAV